MLQQSASELAHSKRFAIYRALGRRASVSECGGLLPLCRCMPNHCVLEGHHRVGLVVCYNKAQASLRTPSASRSTTGSADAPAFRSAAACCRFVFACPTTVSPKIIIESVWLRATTKRKRACALQALRDVPGARQTRQRFGVRRLAAALPLHAEPLCSGKSSSSRSGRVLQQSASELAHSKRFAIDHALGRRASVSECGGLLPLYRCMPNHCVLESHPRVGLVACYNKAQASLRTPSASRSITRSAGALAFRSAAACCRFVFACPTTVSPKIIIESVWLRAATKRKRACALPNASRSTTRSANAPAFRSAAACCRFAAACRTAVFWKVIIESVWSRATTKRKRACALQALRDRPRARQTRQRFGVRRLAAALSLHAEPLCSGKSSSSRSGCVLQQSASELAHSKRFAIDHALGRRASVSECGGLLPLCLCMPNHCVPENHHRVGLVACRNKAQASLRTPKRFAIDHALGKRASVSECGGLLPLSRPVPENVHRPSGPQSSHRSVIQLEIER